MTLICRSPLPMTLVAKHSPQTDDAKHQHLMLPHESILLSQGYIFSLSLIVNGATEKV
jgi:hypothetical protein